MHLKTELKDYEFYFLSKDLFKVYLIIISNNQGNFICQIITLMQLTLLHDVPLLAIDGARLLSLGLFTLGA